MPGPGSHGGWRRHIRACRCSGNSAYGSIPAMPTWLWIPLLGDGMKQKGSSPRYQPDTNYGQDYRRHVAIHNRQVVAGDLVTLPWPEVTQWLLDMALARGANPAWLNYQDVYQHVIEHHTPEDPRRHYGVVANTLRIAVTATGDNDVQLTLGLLGQWEDQLGAAVAPDYSAITPAPFMAGFAHILVDGYVISDAESWTLTVENNIADAPFTWLGAAGLSVRSHAIANLRRVSLELKKLNRSDFFNQAIRDGNVCSFVAQFSHPDGHTWDLILPDCFIEESPEDGTPSKQATENPTLQARVATSGPYAGLDIYHAVTLNPAPPAPPAPGWTTTTTEWPTTTTNAPTTTTTGAPTTTTTTAP